MGRDRSHPRAGVLGDDRRPFVAARLGEHPALLVELRTARALGISLSELRAWPEHDYSTAVALTLYEDGLCQGCGHPLAETTSLDADPNSPDRTHHYVAPIPTRCHACTAIGLRTPEYDEAPQSDALRFRAQRIDDPRDDEHEHHQRDGGAAAP